MEITEFNKSNRIDILDGLRGAAIIFVVVYHILYDLNSIFGVRIGFFNSIGMDVVHFIFLVILIGISGISTSFSKNIFKRGATIYLLGLMITLLTSIFAPNIVIVFGILSFFGMAMLIYAVAKPFLERINWVAQLIIWILLYIVFSDFDNANTINLFFTQITIPDSFRANEYLYPLGIRTKDFHSSDYFSLIPWGFIFLAGTAISKPIIQRKFPKWFYELKMPALDFLGNHTLIIYILHQPLVYGILWIIFSVIK